MKSLTYIVFLLLMLFNVAQAQEISIGIKEAKPFAYQEDGKWKGISVDLIKEVSKQQGLEYKFVGFLNLDVMLTKTSYGEVDMSIAAISLTPEREKSVDFSHKYFTTSLGILSKDKSSVWDTVIWIIKRILIILVFFIVALYVVGFIISKIEDDYVMGDANNGAWWALVTFSTVGYGDKVPKTNKGKLVASAWIVASLFLISIFTGYVSSTLTVKKLTDKPLNLSDLYSVKVVTVKGSTAQLKLTALGINHKTVENLKEGLAKFNAGKIEAVVHDEAMLSFMANSMDNTVVTEIENSEEDYAVALPPSSPLTEKINLGILTVLASPKWKAIQANYNVQ